MKITLKKLFVYALSVGLLTGSALAHGSEDDDYDHDGNRLTVCERSANKMFRSCRSEIREEYFAESAKCLNLGDAGEREECFDEVRLARRENRELCGAQREARSNVCDLLMEDRYDPEAFLSPANFETNPGVEGAANRYFSLTPGHTYVALAGEDFEETIVVTVTEELREVLMEEDANGDPIEGTGVNCRLVVDIVLVDGELVEITDDYYALALNGDVHYCGEVARNFENGILDNLDGSFEAGRDLAKSGILIKAEPVMHDAHRQEFLLGEAEDVIRYVAGAATPTSVGAGEGGENMRDPGGRFICNGQCVKTEEFIPPEPGAGEYKYFIAGIGFVLGVALEDGVPTGERDELLCTGESLDVLPDCGISEETVDLLCELSPVAFCD